MALHLHLLFESASGYALFVQKIGNETPVKQRTDDLEVLSRLVTLKAFLPFQSAENALEQINAISEGELTEQLADFLEQHLNAKKDTLGVSESKLGNAITETIKIKCKSNEQVADLLRSIRLHFHRFVKALKESDLHQAQLGLSHSYSRSKVKFNVHRVDNMIIQSIALLDQLDKDLNTFAMRVKEWYGWHFPELARVVNDNYEFAKLAVLIRNRSNLTPEMQHLIEETLNGDTTRANAVMEAAKHSMGTDISPIDMINIEHFADRVVNLAEYRRKLYNYLLSKMNITAPNLSTLIGELVGARLIAHAGSLTSLAKYPASTVQILGAEKALFRALKTKGNTPKYGLIFHSSFIGRAAPNIKGRISRYLANKCSIASRIDSFGETSTSIFGTHMKQQVEDRLEFYRTGAQPKKNADVMAVAIKEVAETENDMDLDDTHEIEQPAESKKKAKKEKKHMADKVAAIEHDIEDATHESAKPAESKKKAKKEKKHAAKEAAAIKHDIDQHDPREGVKPAESKKEVKKKRALEEAPIESHAEQPKKKKAKKEAENATKSSKKTSKKS